MHDLKCKICLKPRESGRRTCKECHLVEQRKRAKNWYRTNGRHYFRFNCKLCKKSFKAWRRNQIYCKECRNKYRSNFKENCYLIQPKTSRNVHRVLAENILKRKLNFNEVVHHIDEDPTNNSLDNLLVMSRHQHGQLHAYLRNQKLILTNVVNNLIEDWENIRLKQTNFWIKFNNIKVIRLLPL